jgi:hypothetical protein
MSGEYVPAETLDISNESVELEKTDADPTSCEPKLDEPLLKMYRTETLPKLRLHELLSVRLYVVPEKLAPAVLTLMQLMVFALAGLTGPNRTLPRTSNATVPEETRPFVNFIIPP